MPIDFPYRKNLIQALVAGGMEPAMAASMVLDTILEATTGNGPQLAMQNSEKLLAQRAKHRASQKDYERRQADIRSEKDKQNQRSTDVRLTSGSDLGKEGLQTSKETSTLTKKDSSSGISNEIPSEDAADPRRELWGNGTKILMAITGKTQNSARALIGRWLKQAQDEAIQVLGLIEEAQQQQIFDPVSWISAHLRTTLQPAAKPLTAREQIILSNMELSRAAENGTLTGSSYPAEHRSNGSQAESLPALGGPITEIIPPDRFPLNTRVLRGGRPANGRLL